MGRIFASCSALSGTSMTSDIDAMISPGLVFLHSNTTCIQPVKFSFPSLPSLLTPPNTLNHALTRRERQQRVSQRFRYSAGCLCRHGPGHRAYPIRFASHTPVCHKAEIEMGSNICVGGEDIFAGASPQKSQYCRPTIDNKRFTAVISVIRQCPKQALPAR